MTPATVVSVVRMTALSREADILAVSLMVLEFALSSLLSMTIASFTRTPSMPSVPIAA